jgi:hypothetical protein
VENAYRRNSVREGNLKLESDVPTVDELIK